MQRNAELEAQIAKAPDDIGPYTVYADWLAEREDPRGEFISVMLELDPNPHQVDLTERKLQLIEANKVAWLGPLDAKDVDITWRRGFIDAVHFGRDDDSELESTDCVEMYAALRELPTGMLLRSLTWGAIVDDDGEPCWDFGTQALVEHGVPESLRRLAFDRGSYWDISWTFLNELEPAYAKLGKLEQLRIEVGHMDLGTIVLPSLREFEVYTGGFTKQNMAAVVGATWPMLERLILRFGEDGYGGNCTIDDVEPLLAQRFAHLQHLAIGNAPFASAIVPYLAKSPLLRQLKFLDFSLGTFDDDGVASIVSNAGAFAHLERIDISDSYVSPDAVAELQKVGPYIVVGAQRTDEDYRYCSISE